MSGVRGIIIGEAPGPRQPEWSVFSGPSGDRLTRLIGREWREVLLGANLLDYYPGSAPGGSAFPAREARAAARMMMRTCPWVEEGRLVLLAGKRVAGAFGIPASLCAYFAEHDLGTWSEHGVYRRIGVVVIPHPSGRSRWWNDPANSRRASRWMRRRLNPNGS